MERLQKVIANSGYTSRRKAEELIQKGKVKVNGKIITELGIKIKENDYIEIENKPLKQEKKEYYLLYKPEHSISSVKDEHSRLTIREQV